MSRDVQRKVTIIDAKLKGQGCIESSDKNLILLEQGEHGALQGPPDRQAHRLDNPFLAVQLKRCSRQRKEEKAEKEKPKASSFRSTNLDNLDDQAAGILHGRKGSPFKRECRLCRR
jgi:hypothetical protein